MDVQAALLPAPCPAGATVAGRVVEVDGFATVMGQGQVRGSHSRSRSGSSSLYQGEGGINASKVPRPRSKKSDTPPWWRVLLAELLGTFTLLCFGLGVNAQVSLSSDHDGSFLSINFGWGIGVLMGAYMAFGVTGGHLNPALTIACAVAGKVRWSSVPWFIAGQVVGAWLGAAAVFCIYYDALNHFDHGSRTVEGDLATASIFATYPQPFVTIPEGFLGQVVSTAFLVSFLFAITDTRNNAVAEAAIPPLAGVCVVGIGICFGYNTGYAINPARDFAPRLFTYMAGWGSGVWTAGGGWWWVPVVAPIVGGVAGSFVYRGMVELHHPKVQNE